MIHRHYNGGSIVQLMNSETDLFKLLSRDVDTYEFLKFCPSRHSKKILKFIQNNNAGELSSFALTAVNMLNRLTALRAKFNSSLSSLF